MDYVITKAGQKRPYGFKYFPKTGRFERSVRRKYDGRGLVGHIKKKPRIYQRIMYIGKEYQLHNLAFMLMNKFVPSGREVVVDHINGDTCDNRWKNLRLVTKRENDQNKKSHRNGRLCGIHQATRTKRKPWEARIRINGVLKHLGTFETAEEAHAVYLKAVKELNEDVQGS